MNPSNARRLYLIDKKSQSGLSESEGLELQRLQAEVAAHLHSMYPLPFNTLERLEALAERLEQRSDDSARE